eukprot:1137374-Rhodomonas_salina.2
MVGQGISPEVRAWLGSSDFELPRPCRLRDGVLLALAPELPTRQIRVSGHLAGCESFTAAPRT